MKFIKDLLFFEILGGAGIQGAVFRLLQFNLPDAYPDASGIDFRYTKQE